MISHKIRPVAVWLLVLAAGTAAAAAQAAPAAGDAPNGTAEKSAFLRVVRDEDEGPVALETAIVRHRPAEATEGGPVVDLVAAVHVAEGQYYRRLNRELAGYDVVLYELVAREGAREPRKGRRSTPLSFVQSAVKDLLELEFQLDEIDYGPKNMVHADMSPEQFARSMHDRGESFFGMFLRMMGYAMSRQQDANQPTNAQLLAALFDPDRALALKRMMAEQFEDMEGSLLAMEGPNGSTLIGERNKVVIGALRKQLAAGKRKIAVFYGAGHMSDLQRRLRREFGLRPVATRWLVAWNMESIPAGKRGEAERGPRTISGGRGRPTQPGVPRGGGQ